jgi:hypothetical protein
MIDEAAIHLPVIADGLRPAPEKIMRQWLIALGNVCAGQISKDDAGNKINAYVKLFEELPISIFSKATLREAAEQFKFFPSFAEISAFLKARAFRAHQAHERLEALANTQPREPKSEERAPLTDEQKAQFDEAMAKWREHYTNSQTQKPARNRAKTKVR